MAINFMDDVQISTVLNAVVAQAVGKAALATVDTKDFVAVAKIGLEAGYDKLATAISQVLSRTIYSNRPYSRQFKILDTDTLQYGNHVRKVQFIDSDWDDNQAYELTDGQSIDPWEVQKPKAVQTNWYGKVTAQRWVTIYQDQLREAMKGPAEFGSFFSALTTNVQDQIEQKSEETERMTLANLIGGTVQNGVTTQIVHLVTEYNVAIGSPSPALTLTDLLSPPMYADFARWIYGRMETASKALRNRTVLYHQNPTAASPVSGYVSRHTPLTDQRLVIYGPFFDRVKSNVLSTTFNESDLSMIPHEEVTFWQNPSNPAALNLDVSFTKNDGTIDTDTFSTSLVLACLFDREAAGVTLVGEGSSVSPYNPRGKYYNMFFDFENRYYNDNFENAIVFMLD